MMQQKLAIKIIPLAFLICFASTSPVFSEILMYDANDQYLGVFLGDGEQVIGETITVFIPQLGLPVRFFEDGNLAVIYDVVFESNDCSGTPYLSGQSLYPYIALGPCDVYYSVSNKHKSFIPRSYYTRMMVSQCECKKISDSEPHDFIELSAFQKQNLPFTLPVATPLRFKYTSGGDINGDGKTGLEEAVNALQITSGLKNPGPPVGGEK